VVLKDDPAVVAVTLHNIALVEVDVGSDSINFADLRHRQIERGPSLSLRGCHSQKRSAPDQQLPPADVIHQAILLSDYGISGMRRLAGSRPSDRYRLHRALYVSGP